MDTSPISDKSERCLSLLAKIDREPFSRAEIIAWLEGVQLKINLFVSKLGVFAVGSLSIDHRLRRNKTVSNAISQILDAALLDIIDLLHALNVEHTPPEPEQSDRHPLGAEAADASINSEPGSPLHDAVEDEDIEACSEDDIDSLEEHIEDPPQALDKPALVRALCNSIAENVDDLLRYAALIRQFAKAKSESRGDQYSPTASDYEESDSESKENSERTSRPSLAVRFAAHADHVIQRELGPHRYADTSLAYLRGRLKSSMVRRWRRTCYRHAHAESLAARMRPKAQIDLPHSHSTQGDPALDVAHTVQPSNLEMEKPVHKASSMVSGAVFSTATTLQSSFSVSKVPQARSETAKSASRVGGVELSLPPVPSCQRLSSDYIYDCPYCGRLPITRRPFTNRSWRIGRIHLWADLIPHTCLYPDCSFAETEHNTFHAWIEHTRTEHWKPMWTCAHCVSNGSVYETQDAFIDHVYNAHAADNPDTDVTSVANYSRLESFCSECIVCGSEQGIGSMTEDTRPIASAARQYDLQACMANHLEALALSSLPWHFGTIHDASSSQAQGSDVPGGSSNDDSASQTSESASDHQSQGAATLATIALNAEDEGESDDNQIVGAWTREAGTTLDGEDHELLSSDTTMAAERASLNDSIPNEDHSQKQMVRALYSFEPETKDRLWFQRGDIIRVTDDTSSTWWEGECNGSAGRFPSYATEPLDGPRVKPSADPSPLLRAAESGDKALVQLLVEIGLIDVNAKDKTYGQTPLLRASREGHKSVVETLVASGKVDLNLGENSGHTPLLHAAGGGSTDIVRLLIERGAKTDTYDKITKTPLSQAAEKGHEEVVKLLLATGAVDPNEREQPQGWTPLWWAAQKGHAGVVRLLLETGRIQLDAADHGFGQTPLSMAAENGHIEIVKLLLASGADATLRDKKHGLSALEWATEKGHEEVATVIREMTP